MIASRTIVRSTRALRTAPIRANARHVRFASTEVSASTKQTGSSGLVGGLVGGAVVFAAGYGYYYFSGAKSIVNAASTTKGQFDKLTQSMKDKAPEPNELLKWFRDTTTQYAAFIPGAKSYVDAAFNDLDKIEQKHRGEVNEIVSKAYSEMKDATKSGMSVETAQKAWEILSKTMEQLGELASDSAGEILDNHPQLKDKVGGNLDQLKSMANNYGPDAKKELDQTYNQIKDVVKGGVGIESVNKIRQIIQEKVDKVKKLGDEAWKKGMEQAKPYLDKNPEVKKIIDENADSLKQGNFSELFEKIKSGNVDELKNYAKQAGEKAKQSGGGMAKNLEQYAKYIPGGDKILPKLSQLQEVAQKHGDEAQKILKETYDEIADILAKKTDEVEKLAEKAGKDAKK